MELTRADERDPAALRYARWLAWGTRLGLGLLVIGFIAYASGLVDPHVPIERLPALWRRSAAEVLREVGLRPGWGWAELLHRSDMLILGGIGVLATCSIPCLAAVIPVFRRQGAMAFVWICALEIAVLAFALSGLLATGH
jgi:hypothetical protein